MSSTEQVLRHLPYFEALASMEEGSSDWRAVSAGLVVLRQFDAWVEEGTSVAQPRAWGQMAAREAVEAVDSRTPVRALLLGVLTAMEEASSVSIALVAPRLMAYARALDLDGRWSLAIDVYRALLAHAHPTEDPEVVVSANMWLGYCLRVSGDFDAATIAYARAAQIAAATGDIVSVLRARVADAKLVMERGNLPKAEEMLDETIARAERQQLTEIRAIALHDKSVVAHRRGDFERSIRLAYQALDDTRDGTAKDRILSDIAASFTELGVLSSARDANLILAATAQSQYMRWAASINLLELAAIERCEPVFEQHRQELAQADLPPALAVEYHLFVGNGYKIFDRPALARNELRKAIELATKYGLNRSVFMAERSLATVGEDPIPGQPNKEPSRAVETIATRLREMRATLVGA